MCPRGTLFLIRKNEIEDYLTCITAAHNFNGRKSMRSTFHGYSVFSNMLIQSFNVSLISNKINGCEDVTIYEYLSVPISSAIAIVMMR